MVPIPGTTKLPRLDENLGALHVQLTAADLHHIEQALAQVEVHGARYSPQAQQIINR